MRICTLQELYRYNDWADDRLLTVAAGLSDAALDRPFAMGPGSLRQTLNHVWAAGRVWLDRWTNVPAPKFRGDAAGISISDLKTDFQALAVERNAFLAGFAESRLVEPLSFKNLAGQPKTFPYGGMFLHVANHGVHHRAQVVNMLRQVSAESPKPGLDYIFMKLAQPGGGTADLAPPELDADTIRLYFHYGDWAQRAVQTVAASLTDAALDHSFEMGVGTLRKTLLHIRFAEQWWLQNWTQGPDKPFPEMPDATPMSEVVHAFDATATARDAFLSGVRDEDLRRMVHARPRPGVERTFPLGVTLLQLCCHGTHHRAQALNMLRHVGAQPPTLDVVRMLEAERA